MPMRNTSALPDTAHMSVESGTNRTMTTVAGQRSWGAKCRQKATLKVTDMIHTASVKAAAVSRTDRDSAAHAAQLSQAV